MTVQETNETMLLMMKSIASPDIALDVPNTQAQLQQIIELRHQHTKQLEEARARLQELRAKMPMSKPEESHYYDSESASPAKTASKETGSAVS